jgi:PAS domain S-box-containing protein
MKDKGKTKAQFIKEIAEMSLRIAELEKSETKRVEAEIALRESEELYRTLIETSPDSIMMFSLSGEILAANAQVAKVYGASSIDEFLQEVKTIFDLLTEEGKAFAAANLPRVFSEGYSQKNEYLVRVCNGTLIPMEINSSVVRTATGEVRAFISVIRDITERKQGEEALRESEEKYRLIAENMVDVISVLDMNLRFIYVSPSIMRIRGFTVEETMEQTLDQIMTPESLKIALTVFEEEMILEAGGTADPDRILTMELEEYRKDGSIIWVETSLSYMRDKDHKPAAILAATRDITKRKRAEEKLRKSETMLRSVFEAVPLTIAVLDSDRTLRNVNDGAVEMYGYPRDEIIGRNSRFLYFSDEEYKKSGEAIYGDTLAKKASTIEARMRRKDGAEIWVLLGASPLQVEDALTGAVVAAIDITARKSLEAQLRQAQKMQAIGTLAGGIAHDFNNILSAIMGYTDMALTDPKVDDRLRRYLNQVYTAGKRATGLVKQILAFSLQSDQKPSPLRVSPIIKEVLKFLRASLPTTVTIRQDIQFDTDTVLADPTQIHQIMMNLCTNAVHAMRERKGELKISLVPVEVNPGDPLIIHYGLTPDMYLKLTVSDAGIGIAPDIMERIFDPFFTTKNPGEGTGMGLSVVHGIVKSYHGAITVESEVGKGTDFHVYLPLLKEQGEKWEVEAVAHITGGKERILFVDDEEMLVELGKSMLTGMGYDVIGRTSSLEALKLFQSSPDQFDLVITDMTMPNMTGIELAREIMRIRPGIPIILCTGFSEAITPESVKSAGLRELILKPIIKRQIAEAIRRALDYKE